MQELPLKHAKVAAFGMTRRRGCSPQDDVVSRRCSTRRRPVVTIVGKTWDLHVFEVLRVDEAENLAMIHDSVSYIRSQGREVLYDAEHFFDGYFHNPEFALKTVRAAEQAGAKMIVLCDTNGGRLPDDIAAAVKAARQVAGGAGRHPLPHDCDVAVANSLIAVARGRSRCRERSTASANAAATSTWSASSPTWRSSGRIAKSCFPAAWNG